MGTSVAAGSGSAIGTSVAAAGGWVAAGAGVGSTAGLPQATKAITNINIKAYNSAFRFILSSPPDYKLGGLNVGWLIGLFLGHLLLSEK
jgi:hypothetical protein